MRTRTKAAIGVGTTVVVLGGVAVIFGPGWYADRAEEAAADEPSLSASAVPSDTATAAGTWSVSEGSFAGYRVDEVLRGKDVTVTGRTEDVTGQVSLSEGEVTEASIEVKVATIATDSGNRDGYFRDNAIQAEEFPTATFELTEPAALADGATEVDLTGDLTVHGETKSVTVAAEVGADGADAMQVVGSVPITFADFGVEAPNLGFVSVEDSGSVEFSLALTPA